MTSGSVIVENVFQGQNFIVVEGRISEGRVNEARSVKITILCNGKTFDETVMELSSRPKNSSSSDTDSPVHFRCALPLYNRLNDIADAVQLHVHGKIECQHKLNRPLPTFEIFGAFESFDDKWLVGWVYAPTASNDQNQVFVSIDDSIKIPIELDIARPDLNLQTVRDSRTIGFKIATQSLFAAAAGMVTGYRHNENGETKFSLIVGNLVLQTVAIKLQNETDGRIEKFQDSKIIGWAVDQPQRDVPPNVDLYINGTYYATVKASKNRSDLRRRGKAERWGGYEFGGIRDLPTVGQTIEVAVRPENSGKQFSGAIKEITNYSSRLLNVLALSLPTLERYPSVSVIIPVYNAPYELDVCVSSIIANTTVPARLLIINDASPDPRIKTILHKWSCFNNIEIYENSTNLGFTRTVNRGVELAGSDDVIFLNSDTVVPPRWIEQLAFAAYSQERVGTVTPLSNNAGAFSVPEGNISNYAPSDFDVSAMNRIVGQNSYFFLPAAPTGNGFCLYVRRELLETVGALDEVRFPRGYGEENDLCMRGLQAGFKNVIDDRTYVYHKRSASLAAKKTNFMLKADKTY